MTEISNFTMKALREIASIMPYFTPENMEVIKAYAQAEADALKLSAPEQKKRDEYNALITEVSAKLAALKEAETKNAAKLAEIGDAHAKLLNRETAAQQREDKVGIRETSVEKREKEALKQETGNKNYRDELDRLAASHLQKQKDLQLWEDTLTEQANNFEKAQQLIGKKK
jgi:hypothetical protein